MNLRPIVFAGLVAGFVTLPADLLAARVTSDIQPGQKRQTALTTAERLIHRKMPAPVPADLISPFNPLDFDRNDSGDGQGTASNPRPGNSASGGPSANAPAPAPVLPPPPPGNREMLEILAAQLTPSGMIQMGDAPLLTMGSKRFEVGTRFTVTYKDQDYELELAAIDRTTFTLRYRGEEFTRPIKLAR